MSLVQISAPAVEPISVAEAKVHLRVFDTSEDLLIAMLISSARRYAEAYCGRSFITQQWRWVGDYFPVCAHLERGPFQSIDAIGYTDMAGAVQSIATPTAPDWAIDLTVPTARVAPGFGRTWPQTLPQIAAATIDYTTGYGDAATDVPEGIRHWLLVRVNTAYENREEYAVMARGTVSAMPYVDSLLNPYRVEIA